MEDRWILRIFLAMSESKRGNFSTIPFVGILTDEIRNSMDVVVSLCRRGGESFKGGDPRVIPN